MSTTLTGAPARYEKGLREVAPGAYAWLQPNGAWGEANAGLVVGEGEALLIDTLWDERLARELLDAVEPVLAGHRLSTVFNTHSDGDHWWGNGAVSAEATIITSVPSRETMVEDATPAALARMAALAGTTRRLPGPGGAVGSYVSHMLGPFDFAGVHPRLPDRTFSGEELLTVGGREVRLIEVGPAHTPGDAIVHLPDADVVFAADVLFAGSTPVMWIGPLEGWLRALDTLLSLDAGVYVPGHGPPGGRESVVELREYLTWIGERARAHHAAGRSPLDAAREMTGSSEFDRWRTWECPERLVITVDAIHRRLAGEGPIGSSAVARTRLFAQVATLWRELAA